MNVCLLQAVPSVSLWGLDNSLTARMERVPTRVTFPYVHSATTGVLEAALGELESIAPECAVLPWAARLTHQRSACTILVADSSDGMSKGVDNTVSRHSIPAPHPASCSYQVTSLNGPWQLPMVLVLRLSWLRLFWPGL